VILSIWQGLVDIDLRGVLPNDGENVLYSRWCMDETFRWNNCGTIEERGKPKVERVVCCLLLQPSKTAVVW
jgi:hypothetical protein